MKLRVLFLNFVLIVSMVIPHLTFANTADEKHGYWWYQDADKKSKQNEEKKHPKPVIPSREKMMSMHPDDLEKLLDEQRKYAVYTLKEDDVADYYRIQDVVRRKSAAFTALSSLAMLDNPELNANAAYPVTNAARNVYKQQTAKAIETKIAQARNNFAFGFMTRRGCSYCEIMRQTLGYFQDKYQWRIQEFDIDNQPEIATRFNVTVTPVVILIEKNTKRWMPVSIGSDALTNIEQNTYRALRLLDGSSNRRQYLTNENAVGGFFDPEAVGSHNR